MSSAFARRAFVFGYDLVGRAIDPVTIWTLKRRVFPAARLWAMANDAGGDFELFVEGLPAAARKRGGGAVARKAFEAVGSLQKRSEEATEKWRATALEGEGAGVAEAESDRRRAASRHIASQAPLSAAVGRRHLPLVRWEMERPGAEPPDAAAFDAPEDLDALRPGPSYSEGDMERRWLSGPAETELPGDKAYARVSWPRDKEIQGVVVIGSGVGVEWDAYVRMRREYDFPIGFARAGLAAIELASPGHGLRRAADRYGGEAFFAGAPVTSAAMLLAQVKETARLLAWGRREWGKPTAIFGISMSSFAAQLVLSHSGRWPERARPDGGYLMAHSGDLIGVVRGSLAAALGIESAMADAGWTESTLAPWRAALAPTDRPAIAPERIISEIGRLDGVTPFADGSALADAWGLPPSNRFLRPHGHMGLPLRSMFDEGPADRLAEILRG